MKINTVYLAKEFISNFVKNGDTVIDATMGRGNDTLLLCQLVGENGKVFAFDIQEEAIFSTKLKLEQHNLLNRANLILDSHENIKNYIEKDVDLVVFNLGYLPKANHNIATNFKSTIKALKNSMEILKIKGAISLCVYQGGDTGFEEKDAIFKFLKTLDYNKYTVIVSEFFNRPNFPPIFIKIIKEN